MRLGTLHAFHSLSRTDHYSIKPTARLLPIRAISETSGTNAHLDRFCGGVGKIPEMADAELVAAYRLNAASCTDVAKELSKLEDKIALLHMAQAWSRLADLTEKLSEALQNIPAGKGEANANHAISTRRSVRSGNN
jgi:hypothetical protein